MTTTTAARVVPLHEQQPMFGGTVNVGLTGDGLIALVHLTVEEATRLCIVLRLFLPLANPDATPARQRRGRRAPRRAS